MALKQNVQSTTGLEVQAAYIKVDDYSCNKENVVNARLLAYVSQQAANEGKAPIEGSEDFIAFIADYNDNSLNTKKQIYDYVKTLDKYTEAVDC